MVKIVFCWFFGKKLFIGEVGKVCIEVEDGICVDI